MLAHGEMARQLGKVLGREVTFEDIPPEVMRVAVDGTQMPVWQADSLIEDYAHYRRGEEADVTTSVQDATDQAPRSFQTFVHDHTALFA